MKRDTDTYTLSMPPRSLPWSRALRAGAAAYVGTTLVVALLLGSYWAGHTNFPGHQHPPGTPEHTHSLFQVVGAPSVPVVTVVALPLFIAFLPAPLRLVTRRWVRSRDTVKARAPPPRLPARPARIAAPRRVPARHTFHLTDH